MSKTDALDLAGLCLLTLFGFAVWPPLALAVFGGGCILASRNATVPARVREKAAG